MRCEHCGRNEATFYFRRSVNGRSKEVRLCPDCAAALGFRQEMDGMFDDSFDSVFLLLPNLFGVLPEAARLTPAARATLQLVPAPDEPVYETESLLSEEESAAFRQERERNALKVRLREAVDAENYEEAARVRDALKKMEQGDDSV